MIDLKIIIAIVVFIIVIAMLFVWLKNKGYIKFKGGLTVDDLVDEDDYYRVLAIQDYVEYYTDDLIELRNYIDSLMGNGEYDDEILDDYICELNEIIERNIKIIMKRIRFYRNYHKYML